MERGPQQMGDLLWNHRLAEQKALHFIAAPIAQEALLSGGFHAFGDDGHAERLAHTDDRLGDGLILAIFGQVADKGAVDLDGVDREPVPKSSIAK